MIKEAPVTWDDLAGFIDSVGAENVISIVPLQYEFSEEGLITHSGQKTENVGSALVTKYLIIYNY